VREMIFGAILQDLDPVFLSGHVEHVQKVGQVLSLGLGFQRRRELLVKQRNDNFNLFFDELTSRSVASGRLITELIFQIKQNLMLR